MTTPAKPKLLTLLERLEWVLGNIVEGTDYNYTVGQNLVRGLRLFVEATGYPFDMTSIGSDHRDIEYQPDGLIFRYPTLVVYAYVDNERGEAVTKMLKHLADVQKAVEADMQPTAGAGSLGSLSTWSHLGRVTTDEGELQSEGGAGFRLEIQFCLKGFWGEL